MDTETRNKIEKFLTDANLPGVIDTRDLASLLGKQFRFEMESEERGEKGVVILFGTITGIQVRGRQLIFNTSLPAVNLENAYSGNSICFTKVRYCSIGRPEYQAEIVGLPDKKGFLWLL